MSRLKERLSNPFARQDFRELQALRGISFEIHQGEFFGILGRNGSGKSTLLKIMASIYAADAGRVRMAGTVAPFIELGVGFDMELNARDNVTLNGVMMGLSRGEARRRLDEVIDFAELDEFVDLKLKNYSSGMLVRLAFSAMIQADTDVLLIDEVLAVGDAAFQQKCADVFHRMRNERKTVVLVTHNMGAVEEYCHRAMLLNDGEIAEIGDPSEVAQRYLRLNFERARAGPDQTEGHADAAGDIRLLDLWLEDPSGEQVTNVEQGEQIRVRARLEARREVPDPLFGFIVVNADGIAIHEFVSVLTGSERETARLLPGQTVEIDLSIENRLAPGRYFLHHGVVRNRNLHEQALFAPNVLGFVVFGDKATQGAVDAKHEMTVIPEAEATP
jgi:ABC-type polysaccharide/polyol phosphate transport system ATPase subunit